MSDGRGNELRKKKEKITIKIKTIITNISFLIFYFFENEEKGLDGYKIY